MKILENQIIRFIFCFLMLFSYQISALDFFKSEDKNLIWGTGINQFLKFADQDSTKFGGNSHPVTLNEQEIKNALESLEYTEDTLFGLSEDIKPVFTVKHIQVLSVNLAKGLESAQPGQDIIFVLQRADNQLLGLKKRSFLSGRAFYKDDKLNIIIGDYEHFRSDAFEKVIDPSGQSGVAYNYNFGSRKKATKAFEGSAMVDIPGISNKQTDKFRYDWFVIDVKVASDAYLAKISGKKKKDGGTIDSEALEREAAKLARERRLMRAEMARMRKEMQNNNGNGSSVKSIEERIATLDSLLDKKLITQEEYDSKREAILNEI